MVSRDFPVLNCWNFDVVLYLDLTKSHQCPAVTMLEMYLQSNWKCRIDNPGTTIGTKFSVLVVIDHWSTQMNIRDIRRVYPTMRLQAYPRRCELSLSKQSRMIIRFREF